MTERLNKAIKRLDPQELEQVTSLAEALARRHVGSGQACLKLGWVGSLASDYPEYASGVDAAHAATKMWRESIDRNLSK